MRLLFKLLALAVITAGAALAGSAAARWCNTPTSTRQGPPPILALAEEESDLGDRYSPGISTHAFRIKNLLDEEVLIEGFATSCNCAGVKPASGIRLAPRGEAELSLELSLRALDKPGQRLGLLAKCHVGGRIVPAEVVFRYNAVALMWPLPAAWDIGAVSRDADELRRTLQIDALPRVRRLVVTAPPDWLPEATAGNTKPGTGSFTVALRHRRPIVTRAVDDEVVIEARDEAGGVLGRHPFRIVGEIKNDVIAEPASVHFGRLRRGETAEREVSLRSLLGQSIKVKSAAPKGAGLHVVIKGGTTAVVKQAAGAAGEHAGEVRITVTRGGRDLEVIVPVRHHVTGEGAERERP